MAFRSPFALAAAAMLAITLSTGAASAAPGSTVRGEELVKRNCTQCHAVDRPGGSPNSMSPPLHTLYRYIKMKDLALALKQGLLSKHPAMPSFRFSPVEIDDIMTYIRSIQEQAEAI